MKITKEDVDKLSQLDRIEWRQKHSAIDIQPFNFLMKAVCFLAILMILVGILIVLDSNSYCDRDKITEEECEEYEEEWMETFDDISDGVLMVLMAILILEFISLYFYARNYEKIDKQYFKVELNGKRKRR